MNGYKMHHGIPLDPKLAVVARRSGLRRGDVLALWVTLIDHASQNKPRGSIEGIDPERIAVMLDFDAEAVTKTLKAFRDKGMISEDGHLNNWIESQALSSTLRVREHRARKRQEILDKLAEEDSDTAHREKLSETMTARHKKRGKVMQNKF